MSYIENFHADYVDKIGIDEFPMSLVKYEFLSNLVESFDDDKFSEFSEEVFNLQQQAHNEKEDLELQESRSSRSSRSYSGLYRGPYEVELFSFVNVSLDREIVDSFSELLDEKSSEQAARIKQELIDGWQHWRKIAIKELDAQFRESMFKYQIDWADLNQIMSALSQMQRLNLEFEVSKDYYFTHELTVEYVLGYAHGLKQQRGFVHSNEDGTKDKAVLKFNDYQFKHFFSILSTELLNDLTSYTRVRDVVHDMKAQYIKNLSDYLAEKYDYRDRDLADRVVILGDSHAT